MWFFRLFYNLALCMGFLCYLPKLLIKKKAGATLRERLGFCLIPQKTKKKLVWMHAVSMGETKALAPLASLLAKDPDVEIVVSSGTATGHAEAKRTIPEASYYFYFPIDFSWTIRRLLKKLKPDQVILCESDFWWNFLTLSKASGADVFLVNGKISARSAHRFCLFKPFARSLFGSFTHLFIQNQTYYDRFKKLVPDSQKMEITGNLKLDHVHPALSSEEKNQWKKQLGLHEGDFVIVAGSTHKTEEELVLSAIQNIPKAKLLLVPRHPERFDEVEELIKRKGFSYCRFSYIGTDKMEKEAHQIILVDAMGVLKKIYQLADVAIVCGSFVTHVGGHNILEPSEYGVPILFGPYMHTQPELVSLALEFKAGLQVEGGALASTLCTLQKNPEQLKTLGQNGIHLIESSKGATQKTYQGVLTKELKRGL